jgi:hypothetical protein
MKMLFLLGPFPTRRDVLPQKNVAKFHGSSTDFLKKNNIRASAKFPWLPATSTSKP